MVNFTENMRVGIEFLDFIIDEKIEAAEKLKKNMRSREDADLYISMEQEINRLIDSLIDLKSLQIKS